MQSASPRALGSSKVKEKASEAANSRGHKKSNSPRTSYTKSGGDSTAAPDPKAPKSKSHPRKKMTVRRQASFRLAELYRLAVFYRQEGIRMDPKTWTFVLAATLGAGKPAYLPIRQGRSYVRWPGLTLETLRTAVERCQIGIFTDDQLAALIKQIERWQASHGVHLISATRLGEMLNLTAAEREVCRIRSIDACDETREERKARLAEARKVTDREAKKAKRGRTPREIYEGQSWSVKQPWKEAGVSRATWYRKLRDERETGVSAHHI